MRGATHVWAPNEVTNSHQAGQRDDFGGLSVGTSHRMGDLDGSGPRTVGSAHAVGRLDVRTRIPVEMSHLVTIRQLTPIAWDADA
jgi:hypothetical protein